ncbi:MAG TPA: c-type cytochrome domain-containing protein [Adhaeribacter sp.]|nr:c-type cytochrome domain-containing protein [Adhaeribacter sp.]
MKISSRNYWMISLLLCLALAAGCKHEIPVQPAPQNPANPANPGDPGNPVNPTDPGNPNPCDPAKVYFQRDILPILLSNCTMSGCHNATDRRDGVNLTSYASVMATADVRPGNPGNSDLYEAITENDVRKRMPYQLPPLPAAQIDLIRRWIQQGALDETCSNSTCDTTNVTFTATIKPLVQNNCQGCHSGGAAASGGLDFTTHGGLAAVALNGRLEGAVTHATGFSPMPKNGNKLNDCQIAQIRKWISNGAPNN